MDDVGYNDDMVVMIQRWHKPVGVQVNVAIWRIISFINDVDMVAGPIQPFLGETQPHLAGTARTPEMI